MFSVRDEISRRDSDIGDVFEKESVFSVSDHLFEFAPVRWGHIPLRDTIENIAKRSVTSTSIIHLSDRVLTEGVREYFRLAHQYATANGGIFASTLGNETVITTWTGFEIRTQFDLSMLQNVKVSTMTTDLEGVYVEMSASIRIRGLGQVYGDNTHYPDISFTIHTKWLGKLRISGRNTLLIDLTQGDFVENVELPQDTRNWILGIGADQQQNPNQWRVVSDYEEVTKRGLIDWIQNKLRVVTLVALVGSDYDINRISLAKYTDQNNAGIQFLFGNRISLSAIEDWINQTIKEAQDYIQATIQDPKKLEALIRDSREFVNIAKQVIENGKITIDQQNGICLTTVPAVQIISNQSDPGLFFRVTGRGHKHEGPWGVFEIGFDYEFMIRIFCENGTIKDQVYGEPKVDIEDGWEIGIAIVGAIAGALTFGVGGAFFSLIASAIAGAVVASIGLEVVEGDASGEAGKQLTGKSLFQVMQIGALEIDSQAGCKILEILDCVVRLADRDIPGRCFTLATSLVADELF